MNMRIVNTLIKKDFKNCIANKNLLISLAIPVFFCVLYKAMLSKVMGGNTTFILQMCAIFAITIAPTTVLPVMIAEEKEKYTLRSLMLARVNGIEFLAGKLTVCVSLTLFDAVLIYMIAGEKLKYFPVYIIFVLLSSLGLSFLGAVMGLLSKDQTSAGTLGSPLLLLTMMPPIFSGFSSIAAKIAALVPTTSFQTVFLSALNNETLFGKKNLTAMGVCLLWIAAGYLIFHIFYKKKGIDC